MSAQNAFTMRHCYIRILATLCCAASAWAQASLEFALPERTRLLVDQRLDLVLEIRNAPQAAGLRVTANGIDITSRFTNSYPVDLDCDARNDMVVRADQYGFQTAGHVRLVAQVSTDSGVLTTVKDILVYPFSVPGRKRNVILFIGDAMGNSYRDAGRIVARSVETIPGVSGLREGFFDKLLEMDQMPISGMVMTYASDRLVPDSANTASAWAMGNKTFDGALNVFADGTDCRWRAAMNEATLPSMLDNPRVETLWEYMKRKHAYRTGIVTNTYITDATPAGEGSHTAARESRFEVARQFLENPFLNGPAYDVLLGGGKEDFDPDIRSDGRNLVQEFQNKGYAFVSTATDLRNARPSNGLLLGLFRRPNTVARHSSGIRATANGNLDTVYDKLGLVRPASEPQPNFGAWTDQPFLDSMLEKAVEILSGPDGRQPFILMVEGGLIDKQSHPNHAAGTIWDVIELDKAVGWARRWARARNESDTLLLVTADHDQSMNIIGIADVGDRELTDRSTPASIQIQSGVGNQTMRIYPDMNTNVRATYGYFASGGDPNSSGAEGPPGQRRANIYTTDGFPEYMDEDGDGYPENREVRGKGRMRITVGFRTGNHTGTSVPITAEGPGAFLFTGYMDQSDLTFKMAVSLSGDTVEGDAFVEKVLLNPRYPRTIGK
ncbi:MAG TPA: alkaline phosphatase [Bryobacteraceae bacterium]|nr:alkaline phosphatase [Bryobacteraceae bacterium]